MPTESPCIKAKQLVTGCAYINKKTRDKHATSLHCPFKNDPLDPILLEMSCLHRASDHPPVGGEAGCGVVWCGVEHDAIGEVR